MRAEGEVRDLKLALNELYESIESKEYRNFLSTTIDTLSWILGD